MKNFCLVVGLVLSVFWMQSCSKSAISATVVAPDTSKLTAYINDTIWTPTNFKPTITYTAATKTKTFAWAANVGVQQVTMSVTQANASSVGNGFPVTTFNVDPLKNLVLFTYGVAPNTTSTNFVPQGTLKSGYVIVSSIDSVKQTITGTFNFNTVNYTYDTGGNITSLTVNAISGGEFNALPYTYKKN